MKDMYHEIENLEGEMRERAEWVESQNRLKTRRTEKGIEAHFDEMHRQILWWWAKTRSDHAHSMISTLSSVR